MQLGFIGLGKMGLNMVTRLRRRGHEIVAYDRDSDAADRGRSGGAEIAASIDVLVSRLTPPRAVWIMVPAGDPTESTVRALGGRLAAGDVIVDGGNTHFDDDIRRARELETKGIDYVDAGTSGGVWGLDEGYCLMVGGKASVCHRLEPIFLALAPDKGYLRVGDHGAGHYVKMVHNGIEYGLMQAYAEGFELMQASGLSLDLPAIASLWMHGSVVRSWLLELTARALAEDPGLSSMKGHVDDSGEGRWTVQDAIARGVPVPAITTALYARFASRQPDAFANRLLAALRHQFGGHPMKTS